MTKKKPTDKDGVKPTESKPEFKPGDTPYYKYDGILLNANVPWSELVKDIEVCGYSLQNIADNAECELSVIQEVLEKNYDHLNFRTGTRIVTMYYAKNPHMYKEF